MIYNPHDHTHTAVEVICSYQGTGLQLVTRGVEPRASDTQISRAIQ